MHRQFQQVLVIVSSLLLALSFVHGPYLDDQPLQNIPTVLGLLLLWYLSPRRVFSDASMVAIHCFIWLHILGARYIYSYVPYDDWARALTGVTLTETFHLGRNHYDRLVHFLYGVLAMIPQVEWLRRVRGLGKWSALFFSVALVLAVSCLYEIFEWALTLTMAPAWADRYNGQQGDLWDSQKDMACAAVGSVLMAITMLMARRRDVAGSVG